MYAPLVSLMITVPVFGQHEYTHALVADLEREGADYLIVDNRGDYPRIGTERVSTPGENLGWAGERARFPTCVRGGLLPRNDAQQRHPGLEGICCRVARLAATGRRRNGRADV